MDEELSFLLYVAVLLASGLLMLVLAAFNFDREGKTRAINGVLGLAALGYGLYLAYQFLFVEAFEYQRFLFAYALPLIAILQLYRGLKERSAQRAAAQNLVPAPEQQTPSA